MNTDRITFEWPSYDEIERVRRQANRDQGRVLRDAFRALFSRKPRSVIGVATTATA